jgi:hypothetical protein
VEQVESGSEFTYLFPFVFIEVLCNVPLHYPDVSVRHCNVGLDGKLEEIWMEGEWMRRERRG